MEEIRAIWQHGIKIGIIGGIVLILVALIGMIEVFTQRQVIADTLSMGHALYLAAGLLICYMAAKRTAQAKPLLVISNSIFAGLTTAIFLVLLIILGRNLNLRLMFINASDLLLNNLLTFGVEGNSGLRLLLIAGMTTGLITGFFYLLPQIVRTVILWSLAGLAFAGVLQELIRPILSNNFPEIISEWLLTSDGLTVKGAISIFIFIALATLSWSVKGERIRQGWRNLPKKQKSTWGTVGTIILLAIILIAPWRLGLFMSEVLTIVGLYVLLGLGLNIVVGYAGLLDLGYVAFFAIGAYVTALITSPEIMNLNWNLWSAIPFALFFGILAGVFLGVPVLKMRGDYLAIATMGFGEIIRLLVLSDALRPFLGGSQGIGQIAKPKILGFVFKGPQEIYYLIIAGCMLVIFVSWRLKDSRIGRAWKAMREDEDVAQAMGINLVSNKLLAFGTGAGFAALSGVIFGSKIGSIYPHSFNIMVSINIVCLIIFGGIGSIPGVIVGAAALIGLPELLREFAEYRFLVYGIALVIMMLIRPEGLWPEDIRKRELHGGEPNGATG
jgi:branched-chain amino acid transport system permease protein